MKKLAGMGLVMALAVGGGACGGGGGGGGTTSSSSGGAAGAEVAQDDVIDVDALLASETDGAAGAEMIGDPATLRAEAIAASDKATSDVRAVLRFVRDTAVGEPNVRGSTSEGKRFALWERQVDGADVRFWAIRTAENRLRYVLRARRGSEEFATLLTGVVIKHGPRTGSGRLHLSLTRTSDVFTAPGYNGSIHLKFAAHSDEVRARRHAYLNVVPRSEPDATPANFAMDVLRKPNEGGRARLVAVGDDILPVEGRELYAMRVAWKAGTGGRADAVLARIAPAPRQVYGTLHECWDADGNRTAYADNIAANDAQDPNEGDVSNCFTLAEDTPPEAVASADASDGDAELDAALEDSGAADITEVEAADDSVPEV